MTQAPAVLIYLSANSLRKDRYDFSRMGYAAASLLKIGAALSTFGFRIVVYMHRDFLNNPEVAPVLLNRTVKSFQFIMQDDDRVFERVLPNQNFVLCLLWNGIWDLRIQALCRMHGITVVVAEAGWFDRERSIFLDNLGVSHFSSLAMFDTYPRLNAAGYRALIRYRQQLVSGGPSRKGSHILLILNSSDNHLGFFSEQYQSFEAIFEDMLERFPRERIAVRAHPADMATLARALPANFVSANEGSLFEWARDCQIAIGFTSKALYAPLLFHRPVYALGAGLENYYMESVALRSVKSILEVEPTARMWLPQKQIVSAFMFEVVFHRHFWFDEWPYRQSVLNNHVISQIVHRYAPAPARP